MDLTQLANLGEFIGGLAVIGSLVYVGAQIRQNTKAVSAATFQAVSSSSAHISVQMAESPDMRKVFLEPLEMTRDEKFRSGLFLRAVFRNFENYHYQVENGLLDRGVYEGYHNTMVNLLHNPFIREWWPAQRGGYGPEFRTVVDHLLAESRAARTVWEEVADAPIAGASD